MEFYGKHIFSHYVISTININHNILQLLNSCIELSLYWKDNSLTKCKCTTEAITVLSPCLCLQVFGVGHLRRSFYKVLPTAVNKELEHSNSLLWKSLVLSTTFERLWRLLVLLKDGEFGELLGFYSNRMLNSIALF